MSAWSHLPNAAHRIDWLMAGDDGEDTFHERLANDLAKLQEDGDT